MRQVIQYQKTGEISIEDLPVPQLSPGGILVRNAFSLISAGTERTSVSTAQASILGKARSRPDLVQQVMNNVRREGVFATLEKVRNRLDNYKELGYSSAGIVVESSTDEFRKGDRVACGGVGYASHSEVICVPKNLAVIVPDEVGLDEAAYTTVASIAMQGVRQADVRVGERVVVVGLGLVGLLTVQILKASGCAVIGLDVSERNFTCAKELGCDECASADLSSVGIVQGFTRGRGSDAVIITASTKSNEPVELSTQYARKRSKIVVVGGVGMTIPRSPFYEKELEFRISCSYGPGRYDPTYEELGNDYPIGFVRWTERRNMESVLDLMAQRRLDVKRLTTQTFDVEQSLKAYDIITGKTPEPSIGILLKYSNADAGAAQANRRIEIKARPAPISADPVLSFIGAGNHAQSYLIPHLQKLGASLNTVVTSRPVNASSAAHKFGFQAFATDAQEIFDDEQTTLVMITTRHASHAEYVLKALHAGKAVFVEKPLAATTQDLEKIIAESHRTRQQEKREPFLMVGYNRRFSTALLAIKEFMSDVTEPLVLRYRVNAGFLPPESWYQQPQEGGRIIGEVCHFVDALQFVTGSLPVSIFAAGPPDKAKRYQQDNVSMEIDFANGSVGNIAYVANGAPAMPKESIEVFGGGKCAVMENFKLLTLYDGRKSRSQNLKGDKGHAEEMRALVNGFRNEQAPISFESLIATSQATFAAVESLRSREKVKVG